MKGTRSGNKLFNLTFARESINKKDSQITPFRKPSCLAVTKCIRNSIEENNRKSVGTYHIRFSLFHRLITCKTISSRIQSNMLLTFQDRLRIPWRGGAKQVRNATNLFLQFTRIFPLADILGSYSSDGSTAAVTLRGSFKCLHLHCDMFGHSNVFGLLLLLFEKHFSKVID